MKFAFLFPAKVVFAERNLFFRQVTDEVISFDKKNVFFSTRNEKVVAEHSESNSYFRKVGEFYNYLCSGFEDENVLSRLARVPQETIDKHNNYILNPEVYEEEQRLVRERIKAERAAADAEQAKRDLDRAEAAKRAKAEELEKFKAGGYVSWDRFEEFCEDYGVKIAIKVKGWGGNSLLAY